MTDERQYPIQDEMGPDDKGRVQIPVAALQGVFPTALQSGRLRIHETKSGDDTVYLEIGVGTRKPKKLFLPDICQIMANTPHIVKVFGILNDGENGKDRLIEMARTTETQLSGATL